MYYCVPSKVYLQHGIQLQLHSNRNLINKFFHICGSECMCLLLDLNHCCFLMAHRGKQNEMHFKPNEFFSG